MLALSKVILLLLFKLTCPAKVAFCEVSSVKAVVLDEVVLKTISEVESKKRFPEVELHLKLLGPSTCVVITSPAKVESLVAKVIGPSPIAVAPVNLVTLFAVPLPVIVPVVGVDHVGLELPPDVNT